MNVMCFRSCIVLSLALIVLAFFAGNVMADELNWTWTAPTTRADGTPFDMATEGAGFLVKFNGVQELDGNGNPLLLEPGSNGLYKTFPQSGEVCISLATQDVDGRVGAYSEAVNDATQTACKTVLAPPGVINNLSVTIVIQ
jgi:hypothetical protein